MKTDNIKHRKLTKEELLWLYTMGGRDNGDVKWIKGKPFIHMVNSSRKVYNLVVGEVEKSWWLQKYNNINRRDVPKEVIMSYEHQ